MSDELLFHALRQYLAVVHQANDMSSYNLLRATSIGLGDHLLLALIDID